MGHRAVCVLDQRTRWVLGSEEGWVGRATICRPPGRGTLGSWPASMGQAFGPHLAFSKRGSQGSGHDSASCQPLNGMSAQKKDLF